jgi:hypothetical protein
MVINDADLVSVVNFWWAVITFLNCGANNGKFFTMVGGQQLHEAFAASMKLERFIRRKFRLRSFRSGYA